MSTSHSIAAKKFLENQDYARWHDQTFWSVRKKRDIMSASIPEWEELRELASAIKRHTLSNLDRYLTMFADQAEKNGVKVPLGRRCLGVQQHCPRHPSVA